MNITANDIIVTSSVITALGVIFVAGQAYIALTQMKNDHERSRREHAINALKHFDQNLNIKASSSRKFVETLTFDQSKSLVKQESFMIDIKYKELFQSCIKGDYKIDELIKDKQIQITEKISAEIRWQVIIYLNILETVLASWRHNLADRAMIEEQFEFLVLPEEGHYILKDYRKAIGGTGSYPSIEEFAIYIEKERNGTNSGKGKIA